MRRFSWAILPLLVFPLAAQERQHLFHASAVAVEGRDVAPQAAVMLPESGGNITSRVGPYNDGVVRFAEATSFVSGSMDGDVAVTISSVTIRDVDIMGIIHADRIVTRTTARQKLGDAEGTMSFAGSRIAGLTVRGQKVDLETEGAFDRAPTFAALRSTRLDGVNERYGAISGSLFKGSAISIDGVGTLYLGHVIAKPGERRLAMIRLVLEGGGVLSVGANGTNGETMP